jgi:hypothetical protein
LQLRLKAIAKLVGEKTGSVETVSKTLGDDVEASKVLPAAPGVVAVRLSSRRMKGVAVMSF